VHTVKTKWRGRGGGRKKTAGEETEEQETRGMGGKEKGERRKKEMCGRKGKETRTGRGEEDPVETLA